MKALLPIIFALGLAACNSITSDPTKQAGADSSAGQSHNSVVIISTIDMDGYFYIPKKAFADSVDGVYYAFTRKEVASFRRPIDLYWNSNCTEGRYILTITPEQAFFSSGHNNPNPNLLFWVVDIDDREFQQIRLGLEAKPPRGFKDLSENYNLARTVFVDTTFTDLTMPEEWNDTTMKQHSKQCEAQVKTQGNKFLTIINSYVADPTKQIKWPVGEMEPRYFGSLKEELLGWIPKKRPRNYPRSMPY